MKKFFARSWAVVDLDILQNNVRILRRLFPNDCHFLAVIKAEGYGLGMLPTAQACIRGGADWFGVATVKEALQLREAGITLPILVLGVTPPEWAEELGEYQLSQVVPSLDYAEAMSQRAAKTAVSFRYTLRSIRAWDALVGMPHQRHCGRSKRMCSVWRDYQVCGQKVS